LLLVVDWTNFAFFRARSLLMLSLSSKTDWEFFLVPLGIFF
jgi:hypothetical protein